LFILDCWSTYSWIWHVAFSHRRMHLYCRNCASCKYAML
jgi:hypothetical protein